LKHLQEIQALQVEQLTLNLMALAVTTQTDMSKATVQAQVQQLTPLESLARSTFQAQLLTLLQVILSTFQTMQGQQINQ
jgi:hypothetical protein